LIVKLQELLDDSFKSRVLIGLIQILLDNECCYRVSRELRKDADDAINNL